jgi:hypothetical protein
LYFVQEGHGEILIEDLEVSLLMIRFILRHGE